MPLTYVYSAPHSHEPLARIDGVNTPDIFWFHNQPNGTPERLTDAEGRVCQKTQNSAWGKLLHERDAQLPYAQNLRMQGQYLDRETFVRNKFESLLSAAPAAGAPYRAVTFAYDATGNRVQEIDTDGHTAAQPGDNDALPNPPARFPRHVIHLIQQLQKLRLQILCGHTAAQMVLDQMA